VLADVNRTLNLSLKRKFRKVDVVRKHFLLENIMIEEIVEVKETEIEADPRTDLERALDEWQAEWTETYQCLREDMQ
jgi:hypothetical protein